MTANLGHTPAFSLLSVFERASDLGQLGPT